MSTVSGSIHMLDEMIQDELFFTGRVSARDVKKVASIKGAMYRDWTKLHNSQTRAAVKDANNAMRYLKRSSNQLIKSLKARAMLDFRSSKSTKRTPSQ